MNYDSDNTGSKMDYSESDLSLFANDKNTPNERVVLPTLDKQAQQPQQTSALPHHPAVTPQFHAPTSMDHPERDPRYTAAAGPADDQPSEYYENEYHDDDNNNQGQVRYKEDLAYADPYADSPFPDENDDVYEDYPGGEEQYQDEYNDAEPPHDEAEDRSVSYHSQSDYNDIPHPIDPYGELDYSMNTATREEELEEMEMSRLDHLNLRGGEFDYPIESKDAKMDSWWQSLCLHYKESIIACGGGLCFALLLITLLLVGTTFQGSASSSSSSRTDSLSPWGPLEGSHIPRQHLPPFVPPPIELETLCTQEAIAASKEGFDQCAGLCAPAQCCRWDPVAAPDASCQIGHEKDCQTYHHFCQRPPKAAIIPFQPPPANLDDLCLSANIKTEEGLTACARACAGGTCCQYPTSLAGLSCLRGNEEQCQIYHANCEKDSSNYANGNSDNNNNNAPPAADQVQFPFTAPADDIGQICGSDHVMTETGFEDCLEVCRGGTCCRFDPAKEPSLSCRNDHTELCLVYDQYCGGNAGPHGGRPHSGVGSSSSSSGSDSSGSGFSGGGSGSGGGFNNNNNNNNDNSNNDNADNSGGLGSYASSASNIPTTYVEQVCGDASLATPRGYEDCRTVCGKAECCWKQSADRCPKGSHCAPFSHCLALEASDHIDEAIQNSVNLKCTDTNIATLEGHKACLLACAQATCCFGNTVAGECPHEDDSFCNQYDACKKVLEDNGTPVVPPAPSTLAGHCDPTTMDTVEGFAQCERACAHAPCCWDKKVGVESCAESNPLCEDYAPCSILVGNTEDSTSSAPDSAGGTSEGVGDSQSDTGDNSSTPPTTFSVPTAPSFLEDVCTAEKVVNVEGSILCHDACKVASCCWKDASCSSVANCEGYKPCAVLQDAAGLDENGMPFEDHIVSITSVPVIPALAVDPVPTYLGTVCASEANGDGVHGHLCFTSCKKAECCWNDQSEFPCTDNPNCDGYDICANVDFSSQNTTLPTSTTTAATNTDNGGEIEFPTSILNYTVEMITDVCMNHDNSVGVNLCEKACAGSDCCFKNDGICGSFPCYKYSACSILHPEDTEVDEACSDTSDLAECVNACGGSTCCFTNDITKSCANTNPRIVCSRYEACEKLYGYNS